MSNTSIHYFAPSTNVLLLTWDKVEFQGLIGFGKEASYPSKFKIPTLQAGCCDLGALCAKMERRVGLTRCSEMRFQAIPNDKIAGSDYICPSRVEGRRSRNAKIHILDANFEIQFFHFCLDAALNSAFEQARGNIRAPLVVVVRQISSCHFFVETKESKT